jgi:hypothetical protein
MLLLILFVNNQDDSDFPFVILYVVWKSYEEKSKRLQTNFGLLNKFQHHFLNKYESFFTIFRKLFNLLILHVIYSKYYLMMVMIGMGWLWKLWSVYFLYRNHQIIISNTELRPRNTIFLPF